MPDIQDELRQTTRKNKYQQPKAKKLAMSLDIWETTLEDYYKLGGTVIWGVEEILIVVNKDKAEMDSLAATGDVVFIAPRKKPSHFFKEVCFAKRVDITPMNWMHQDLWEDEQYYQKSVYHWRRWSWNSLSKKTEDSIQALHDNADLQLKQYLAGKKPLCDI